MDNSIVPDNTDDLKNERAAVAMLLAAAASQVEEAAAPEPVGGEDDFNGLLEKQKALAKQREILKNQEAELLARLQSLREEAAKLERQADSIKRKARTLYESTFGIGTQVEQPQAPAPVAGSAAPSRKLDNSVVFDRSCGVSVTQGASAPAEVNAVTRIPSLSL